MLKLRYDKNTGKIGSAYTEDVIVPEPYLLVTEEENGAITNRDNTYVIDGKLVDITGTDKEKKLLAEKRKAEFYKEFIATTLGNYRLQPKGYANAQQTMDVTNTMVLALGGLTKQITSLVIFYPTPDFTDETQCTEEYLIAHQTNPPEMTLEEWTKFYVQFCQLYATQQYQK